MPRVPSSLDPSSTRRHFAKAAPHYDEAAVIQREIAERLHERLQYLKLAPERILDLGCGTGHSLSLLREKYPKSELWALDFALPMLHIAQKKLLQEQSFLQKWFSKSQDRWIVGDLGQLPLQTGSMNLMLSSLALQWSSDRLAAVFAEWHRVLALQGAVFFATLGPDTLHEVRTAFSQVDHAPRIHTFVDMHDIGDELVHAGFADPVIEMERITVRYTRPLDVFADLKAIGAVNSDPNRPRGLMGKTRWKALVDAWEKCGRNNEWHVTYEVIYGHAWKTHIKLPEGLAPIQFHR